LGTKGEAGEPAAGHAARQIRPSCFAGTLLAALGLVGAAQGTPGGTPVGTPGGNPVGTSGQLAIERLDDVRARLLTVGPAAGQPAGNPVQLVQYYPRWSSWSNY
jgi:hypothetical protein